MKQLEILLFYLPLFASWLLMTAEGPIISATVNRLPNATIMLAAQGIVIGLSVFIEAPVINLLSTSTALVKDRQSYNVVKRFTVHLMLGLTVITFLVGFTPLFNLVVVQLMGAPPEIAVWVRPGMQVMLFWSAAIGWRRFLQGVLINFGYTRRMAEGTLVRLIVSAGTVIGLALTGRVPGVYVATLGWMTGVIAEALFATWAIRPLFQNELAIEKLEPDTPDLTYSELFWFHLPLANTSILILLGQPLVTAALARLDNPAMTLAAWPVVYQTMLLMRAPALALPEVVIALSKRPNSGRAIHKFSLSLATLMFGLTALVVFTPANNFYFSNIQGMEHSLGQLSAFGLRFFLFFPFLWVLTNWFRGLLIYGKVTKAVNRGMMINLTITIIILAVGLLFQWNGLMTGALALNLASFAEVLYLGWQTNRILDWGLGIFDWVSRPAFHK